MTYKDELLWDVLWNRLGPNHFDGKELREYMQETFGALRDDRSTASYALEFLKTERANLLMAQGRS